MTACLMAGALMLTLAAPDFTLSWQHSVERVEWREDWRIEGRALRLVQAAVKGSGAGMEPGPDARLVGGWWVWSPDMAPVPGLVLAASGSTAGGWTLCSGGACQMLGSAAGEALALTPCPR